MIKIDRLFCLCFREKVTMLHKKLMKSYKKIKYESLCDLT